MDGVPTRHGPRRPLALSFGVLTPDPRSHPGTSYRSTLPQGSNAAVLPIAGAIISGVTVVVPLVNGLYILGEPGGSSSPHFHSPFDAGDGAHRSLDNAILISTTARCGRPPAAPG